MLSVPSVATIDGTLNTRHDDPVDHAEDESESETERDRGERIELP